MARVRVACSGRAAVLAREAVVGAGMEIAETGPADFVLADERSLQAEVASGSAVVAVVPADRCLQAVRAGARFAVDVDGPSEVAAAALVGLARGVDAHREHLATVGELASCVAHEIRNPLAGLRANAELLHMQLADGDPKRRITHHLVEQTDRLSRVLDDVLTFARPDRLEPAPTPPAELLSRLGAAVGPQAEAGGVELRLCLEDRLPPVMVDAEAVERVFLNLALNALAAMPRGGRLTVSAERTPEGVLFTFEDTGEGIAEEDLERVFEPFFTRRPGGTGLGLAIAARIVRQHGGSISISSTVGKGTRVRVLLPAVGFGEGRPSARSASGEASEGGRVR